MALNLIILKADNRSRYQRAGTLVELLVAMGIISTMAGMFLPALQGGRERARANACRNNLKQIGVALLNYESIHRHFPKGAEGRYDPKIAPAPMIGLSWWPAVLPHLEERDVAARLDRTGPWTGWVQFNPHNGQVVDGFGPSFFYCPSSSLDHFIVDDGFQVATPAYVGISGATSHDGFPETRVSPACCFGAEIAAGGVLVPNTFVRTPQITDGLSNTLLVGEQSDFAFSWQFGKQMRIDGGYLKGWLAGTYVLGVPPRYERPNGPSYNVATVRYPLNERRYDLPGVYFDRGANNPLLSPHPGLVHLLHCDGSVHAALDAMDVAVLKSLATRDEGMPAHP
jgi:type II secretory pathway pseudopilin PulG